MKALIGRKIGMGQAYGNHGKVEAVTLLAAGPCVVTQIRNDEKDGYKAIQLGFEESKKHGKTALGHLKPSGSQSKVLREFRLDGKTDAEAELKVGDKLDVSQFEAGQLITISSISKGKGFSGTIKRYNFKRGPKTHGSKAYRGHGSIGSMFPQKVFKGKKMAGRMGQDKVTLKQVKIIDVDPETNILAIRGPVAGPNKTVVTLWSQS